LQLLKAGINTEESVNAKYVPDVREGRHEIGV
jgi:hypothetical protein